MLHIIEVIFDGKFCHLFFWIFTLIHHSLMITDWVPYTRICCTWSIIKYRQGFIVLVDLLLMCTWVTQSCNFFGSKIPSLLYICYHFFIWRWLVYWILNLFTGNMTFLHILNDSILLIPHALLSFRFGRSIFPTRLIHRINWGGFQIFRFEISESWWFFC